MKRKYQCQCQCHAEVSTSCSSNVLPKRKRTKRVTTPRIRKANSEPITSNPKQVIRPKHASMSDRLELQHGRKRTKRVTTPRIKKANCEPITSGSYSTLEIWSISCRTSKSKTSMGNSTATSGMTFSPEILAGMSLPLKQAHLQKALADLTCRRDLNVFEVEKVYNFYNQTEFHVCMFLLVEDQEERLRLARDVLLQPRGN